MRGSQWEGRGSGGQGLRLDLVLGVLAVVVVASLLVAFYYIQENQTAPVAQGQVTTITTTGIGCGNDSMPQGAQDVEQDPRFASLSDGYCYNYMGENSSGGATVLTFNYYNGTIVYPCGTQADDLIGGQIKADTSSSTGAVTSVQKSPEPALNPSPACPAPPPVAVVSVVDVGSLIPAVPELNVTLVASAGDPQITSLRGSLTLEGGSQQFTFVAHPSTLAAGESVSKTEILSSDVQPSSSELYPMQVSGTFADGQTFSFEAYVQVAGVP